VWQRAVPVPPPVGVVDVPVEDWPAGAVVAEPVGPPVLDALVLCDVSGDRVVEWPFASVTEPRKEQAHTTSRGSRAAAARTGDEVMAPR
jgi:hypothetical protein